MEVQQFLRGHFSRDSVDSSMNARIEKGITVTKY